MHPKQNGEITLIVVHKEQLLCGLDEPAYDHLFR